MAGTSWLRNAAYALARPPTLDRFRSALKFSLWTWALYWPGGGLLLLMGGLDLVSGQEGDDVIEARDGMFDTIGCDGGFDTVFADRFDLVSPACDDVTRGAGEEPSV